MESLSVLICRVANNYKIHLINLIKDHVSSSIIEANKCIKSIPEVNWSIGSLNKAEALIKFSVHLSNSLLITTKYTLLTNKRSCMFKHNRG